MKINPRLIIGLGNPDEKYRLTYHNVGFLFVDYLRQKGPACRLPAGQAGRAGKNKNFILIKPKTFMNESGKAVLAAMKYLRTKPEKILVVHDDSDIELGKSKLSFGRGAAGHKGVESIIKSLGTKNFWRLRIGIRKAGLPAEVRPKRTKAGEIVLKKITPADKLILEEVFNELGI